MKKTLIAMVLSSITCISYAQEVSQTVTTRTESFITTKENINQDINHRINVNMGTNIVNGNDVVVSELEIPLSEYKKINGFAIDSRGHAVRSSDGRCVITGTYDPATAYHPECTPKVEVAQTEVTSVAPAIPQQPTEQPVAQPQILPAPIKDNLQVYFAFDSAKLSEEAQSEIKDYLQNNAKQENHIEIVAGADYFGTNKYNRNLSARRANSIANYIKQLGYTNIESVKGVGEEQAHMQNSSECQEVKGNKKQMIQCIATDRFGTVKIIVQ